MSIPPDLLGHKLVWAPPATASTNSTVATFIDTLMDRVLTGVTGSVLKVANSAAVESTCRENFNLLSECFAAITFSGVDPAGSVLVRMTALPRQDGADTGVELYHERRLWSDECGRG